VNLSESAQAWVAVLVGLATLSTTAYMFVAKVRPWWRDRVWKKRATDDFFVGRPASRNRITGELTPALPSAAERFDEMAVAIKEVADSHRRIDNHESRIKALEDAAVERFTARAESVAAFRAMEAAAKAEPTEFTD